jgi:hypothetical protein
MTIVRIDFNDLYKKYEKMFKGKAIVSVDNVNQECATDWNWFGSYINQMAMDMGFLEVQLHAKDGKKWHYKKTVLIKVSDHKLGTKDVDFAERKIGKILHRTRGFAFLIGKVWYDCF